MIILKKKERGNVKFAKRKRYYSVLYLELSFKKINQNNPYEISKFEKNEKTFIFYSRWNSKKYVLEDFLKKLKI